jgi:hypothetical protein
MERKERKKEKRALPGKRILFLSWGNNFIEASNVIKIFYFVNILCG